MSATAENILGTASPEATLPPKNPRDAMLYPPNILEAFGSGAMLDLRARFAMQLLYSSPYFHECPLTPVQCADEALDIAEQLFSEATRRGWVQPIDSTDEAMAALIAHAKRQGESGAAQQLHGAKTMQEAQSSVTPARFGVPGSKIGH